MSRVAVLIRTHYVDARLRRLAEQLRQGGGLDVHIVADESGGPLDFGDLPKVSLTAAGAAALGLYELAPNLFWRCGDYALYAARRALPGYDAFWMIEPDVRLNSDQPLQILARFPGPEQADFLAGRLKPAEPDWDWARTLDRADGPIWRCLFALVRVSARAIDLLLEERCKASHLHRVEGRPPEAWPNDEAFVATTLARRGLVCRDLNDFGELYEEAGFSFWFPLSERELEAAGRDGRIYHPVLSGQAYFIKLCRLAVRFGALDELERIVGRMIGLEWTEVEARAHLRAIDFLRAQRLIGSPPPLAAE